MSRARRGMALVAAVVLSLIATTVAMVVVQQALSAGKSAADRSDVAVAERISADTVAQFQDALAGDPSFYLTELFYAERPRVCADTGAVVAASGDPDLPVPWSPSCGAQWQYVEPGHANDAYNPADVLVRAQIAPPSTRNPHLTLTVLATVGSAEHATITEYQVPSAADVAVYSGTTLDLDALAGPDGTVQVAGTVYAPSAVNTLTREAHAAVVTDPLAGARLLSECNVTGPLNGAAGIWEAPAGAARTSAGCLNPPTPDAANIRALSASALHASAAARSLAEIPRTACGQGGPTFADGASSFACLTAGRFLVAADGTLVTVQNPDGSAPSAYRVTFETVEEIASMRVAVAGAELSDPADVAAAQAAYVAGTHPASAAGTAWTDLGLFPLPATGVVATDALTYVGQCDTAFGGSLCTALAPGAPVTIVAGTVDAPRDLVLSAPAAASVQTPLGLVASASVRFAFFAYPAGADLQVSAHVYAAGLAVSGPALVTQAVAGHGGGALNVTGSLGAASLSGLEGWSSVHVRGADASALVWFPSFTPYWREVAASALLPRDLCAQMSCAESW